MCVRERERERAKDLLNYFNWFKKNQIYMPPSSSGVSEPSTFSVFLLLTSSEN